MGKTPLFVRKQSGGAFTIVDETMTTGNIFFVDSGSTTGSDATGYGNNPDAPFATIDYAVGKCTANNNDHIIVMAGHAEAVTEAGELDFDVAGITVVGQGVGTTRPTITLSTATTADVDVGAANVTIRNLRFVSGVEDLAVAVDVNEDNCTIEDCDFIGSGSTEMLCGIDLLTTKDGLTVRGCYFFQDTDPDGTDQAASTGAIFLVDSENVLIEDCRFSGFWESAFIHNRTTLAGELWIRNCFGTIALSTSFAMVLVDNATGGMVNSHFCQPGASDVTEAKFVTIAATTAFGLHKTTFMNDGAGGNAAVEVAAAT